MKKSSLTFFNQDGGEIRTFGNEKDKEGKHLGCERIRLMSIGLLCLFHFYLWQVVGELGLVLPCLSLRFVLMDNEELCAQNLNI